MGVELELKGEREGGWWREREERCRNERRKEGKYQGTKKKKKKSLTLSFQDLGFNQLTLGLVIMLTFEIEHN